MRSAAPRDLPPLVILCGGENSRLRTLQGSIYKPFLDLQGSTIVAKYIERARREGISRVLVVTDERDALVSRLLLSIREANPAIEVSELFVAGSIAAKIVAAAAVLEVAPLLVALGDTFAWYSFQELAGVAVDSAIVVAEYVLPFGIVETNGELVSQFVEKPSSGQLINLGQMLLGPRSLVLLREGRSMEETLSAQAALGQLGNVRGLAKEFLTVDTPGDAAAADDYFRLRD